MASPRRPHRIRRALALGLLGCCCYCISTTTTVQAFLLHPSTRQPAAAHGGAMYAAGGGGGGGNEPIKVTPELIKHTATLAQLSFDDAEIAALVPRFQAFLGFVDKMREVPDDAPGMATGAMPEVEAVLRADTPAVFANQDGIFANMPAQEEGYLRVPKVGEEEL